MNAQNSKEHTPGGPDEKGDTGVKLSAKRAKTIIRKGTSYTDEAIAKAKSMRGA